MVSKMKPLPLYEPRVEDGAYALRYSWTGWPSVKVFLQCPTNLILDTKPLGEGDGLRVLEFHNLRVEQSLGGWKDVRYDPDVAAIVQVAAAHEVAVG